MHSSDTSPFGPHQLQDSQHQLSPSYVIWIIVSNFFRKETFWSMKLSRNTLSVSIWAIGSSTSTWSPGSAPNLSQNESQKRLNYSCIRYLRHKAYNRSCNRSTYKPALLDNILFKNFAKVPSLIDSPIKGTTASTRSPSLRKLSNWVYADLTLRTAYILK